MMSSNWQSTGKEPQVFRAEKPEELFGVHADLIAAALTPGERLRYLLYARAGLGGQRGAVWDTESPGFPCRRGH